VQKIKNTLLRNRKKEHLPGAIMSKIGEVFSDHTCYDEATDQELTLSCCVDDRLFWYDCAIGRAERSRNKMDMKLELVPVPVSDVDRAKTFYVEKVGFNVDHDVQQGNGMRVVQLTPPGSNCSIVIGTGLGEISEMQPGTVKALHLVVADITRAREALASRGVEVGEVDEHPGGIKYVYFSDPDDNSWLLQEMPAHQ